MSNSQFQNRLSMKSYLIIGIIVVLVVTNGLLFLQNQQGKSEIKMQNLFQSQALQSEITHLEEQLRSSNESKVLLENELLDEKKQVEIKLQQIKSDLSSKSSNQSELDDVKREIVYLRSFVKRYQFQIDSLQRENENLVLNNQQLNAKLSHADKKIENLSKSIKKGKYLQIQHLAITALKQRFGRKSPTEKASRVQQLKIEFEVLPNNLLEKGKYTFYMRVFDPLGNLITKDQNTFKFKDEMLQYSFMSHIDFQNESSSISFYWKNPRVFEEGRYSILIYAQQKIIAEAQLILK